MTFAAAYLAFAILVIWVLAPGRLRWLVAVIAIGWPLLLALGAVNELRARRTPPKYSSDP